MIHLSENFYMGEGMVKVVYRHPDDENVCIKFPNRNKKRALVDIRREIYYLKKHQNELSFLAPYLGTIRSNLGTGYMYEIVRNEDGSLAHSIKSLEINQYSGLIKEKLISIYQQLIDRRAIINDVSLNNFFLKKKRDDFDLVLIDGFGNTDFVKIADYSRWFHMQKLNRKFIKLCGSFNLKPDFLIK